MKKYFAILTLSALLVLTFPTSPANATAFWDVTGSYDTEFHLTGDLTPYVHDMFLTQDSLGNVTGNGGYPADNPYTFAWTITNGTVSGNNINLTMDYTLGAIGTTMHMTGTIADDGSMSGDWDDNYGGGLRTGTWATNIGLATAVSDNTIVVRPSDMQGWGFLQETATGTGALVAGPATPPAGTGSANLIVDSTGGEIIGMAGYTGTRLDEITNLEYSTYRTSGGAALAIALQFNIDDDVTDLDDSWKGRLVYEPYHTQTVNTGVWETWDAMDDSAGTGTGNWWFSNGGLAGSSGCSMATPCTWSEVLAAFPNGGIHNIFGAVILKAGGGWAGGFDGNADALTVGVNWANTTYDFEPENEGPITSNVFVISSNLTAFVDDATTGGHNILSSEYNIDGGLWNPMEATDGTFDEVSEDVNAGPLPTLGAGTHEICVRGTDVLENLGDATCTEVVITTVVSGGGNYVPDGPKGKKLWTFAVEINVDPQLNISGKLNLVDHLNQKTCYYDEISDLDINGNIATFKASGADSCPDLDVIIEDNNEPGAGVDRIGATPTFSILTITGGNFQVWEMPEASLTFTATDSTYYNCSTVCGSIYGNGPIAFTWDLATGDVIIPGGLYEEIVPPTSGTHYFNEITDGSVIGGVVNLTFVRTDPNSYGPFLFTGTLSGNTLSGMLDGPYLFTATGTITP